MTILAGVALVAAISFNSMSAIAQSDVKLNPGDDLPAMEVSLKNVTGKPTSLKEAAGKNGLLVMFSCNTCPFVVKNEEATAKAIAYAKSHNVGMVIINSNEAKREGDDSYSAMTKYAKQQKYTVPYLLDENSQLANKFGANHTPEIFLFNSKNKLVYKGAMNDNPSNPAEVKQVYIEDAINAMVAGKEVNPNVTKSIGCSIKRKA